LPVEPVVRQAFHIVDWEYNLDFLKKALDRAKVVIIPEADHQLLNERQDLREKAFLEIERYLKK